MNFMDFSSLVLGGECRCASAALLLMWVYARQYFV